jgi:hypothetical protein
MDEIIKSFSLSFLLRNVFAGVFFAIAYYAASKGTVALGQVGAKESLSVGLPLGLFAGVTVYGLHRSLLYPWIEWVLETGRLKTIRESLPLISFAACKRLQQRWSMSSEKESDSVHAQNVANWADYAHLQYTSALCILLGAITGTLLSSGRHKCYCPLVILGFLLALAGFVSDWRLRSVLDHLAKHEAKKEKITPAK